MIGHEFHAREVKTGRKRDAVDAAVKCGRQACTQSVEPRIHRELFHAVDQDETMAGSAAHDVAHIAAGRFLDIVKVESHGALIHVVAFRGRAFSLFGSKARTE